MTSLVASQGGTRLQLDTRLVLETRVLLEVLRYISKSAH